MRMLTRIALAFAAVAVVTTAVAVAAAAQPRGGEARPVDKRFEVQITDEMIRHSRIEDTLYLAGTAWTAAMLLLLLLTPASRAMRDAAARVTQRPFVRDMLYVVMLIVALGLLTFPLTYYGDFVVPHQFALTDQTFGAWMGEMLKGLGIALALFAPIGALALVAVRNVRRWWLVLWACSIPVIVFMVIITPVVLDPMFNKFEPLKDQVLKAKLLDLASRAGIERGRVYQSDKSKQTKTMNAYVTGLGPTARIVMWDTLLQKMDHDEVLAVMGHEMGHYVLLHIWKGLGVSLAISFFVFLLGQKLGERGLSRWGARWNLTSLGDPAAAPWLLLVFFVLGFLVTPIGAAYSRHVEHESDIFSLELTHLNEPMATAFVKLAENSKRDPNPNPLMEYWCYSHPPIGKRIRFALEYPRGAR